MKKILIYGPSQFHGGIETYVENVLKTLKGRCVFTILQISNEDMYHSQFIKENELAEIINLGFQSGWKSKLTNINLKKFDKYLEHNKFDIIHINENSASAYWLAKIAIKHKVKVIYQSHNSKSHSVNFSKFPKFLITLLRKYQVNQLKKLKIKRIAVSDKASQFVFPNDTNVEYIWNSIDSNKFSFNKSFRLTKRRFLGIPQKSKVGLFVGRLSSQKNLFWTLNLVKKALKLGIIDYFIFLGDGPLKEKFEIELKLLDENLKKRCLYLGQQDKIGSWYSVSDILLMPSIYEGLPFTLVEAQASGLRCLVSNVITKQVQYTDLLTFKELSRIPDEWLLKLNELSKSQNYDRNKYIIDLKKSLFSNESFKKNLEKLYGL
ncbi:glycosyltransferase [Lactococcus lactis]|uniref:glycosyltransferase n=1 Tax=Lactococcus lactis TaxID=1358 RepID=UPI00129DE6E0|nr:glycosyltransferase [Lactococcus lactis]